MTMRDPQGLSVDGDPRRLIVMRHAKSSWASPSLQDHARPLNRRGRLAAPLMGAWLREMGDELGLAPAQGGPVHVWLSDSQRTRETWDALAPIWGVEAATAVEPRLYHAETAALFAVLRATPTHCPTAMVVGHNPGVEDWLSELETVPKAPAGAVDGDIRTMPTAAIAVFAPTPADFSWASAGPNAFQMLAFAQPKSLV